MLSGQARSGHPNKANKSLTNSVSVGDVTSYGWFHN